MPEPTIVFDTYWKYAARRQEVYWRRLEGGPGPYCDDDILNDHRFTNVYRASDRVSQYLINQVQNNEGYSQSFEEVFFRTILFKIFNRIETWEGLGDRLGPIEIALGPDRLKQALGDMKAAGQTIYSAAYIMASPQMGNRLKHENHIDLLFDMMKRMVPSQIAQTEKLGDVYGIFLAEKGIGKFLAFQYAIDMNYSDLMRHGEEGFVVAGPGALDGLSKCFEDFRDHSPEDLIYWVTQRQEEEFFRLGLDFEAISHRPLQPIDCQNVFCEISKYARKAHPEIAGVAQRSKIKQSYRYFPTPMPQPSFPDRWNINLAMTATDHGGWKRA